MVEAMRQEDEDQVRAPGTQSQQPVAGLLAQEDAERVAERLDEEGIPTRVADGGFAAEGRFGSQVLRGAATGALIAIPIAVVVALLAWSRNHAGVSPLVPLFYIGAAIVAIGAGFGAFWAMAWGAPQVERPTAIVVARPPDPRAAEQAADTIQAAGGEPTEPLVEREATDSRRAPGRPHLQ